MERFLITGVAYAVSGFGIALIAVLIFRERLSGRVGATALVSLIGAFAGGILDSLLLDSIGDVILLGGIVDIGPALVVSVVLTAVYILSVGEIDA